jgi:chromosome partitioning protein
MYDGRTMHCREAVDVLHANFGDTVFRTRIGKTVRFAEAPVQGQSALKFDSGGQSARWYRQVAREVLERDGRWSDDLERMRNTQNAAPSGPAPVLRLAS